MAFQTTQNNMFLMFWVCNGKPAAEELPYLYPSKSK